jgi:hypothetical protein
MIYCGHFTILRRAMTALRFSETCLRPLRPGLESITAALPSTASCHPSPSGQAATTQSTSTAVAAVGAALALPRYGKLCSPATWAGAVRWAAQRVRATAQRATCRAAVGSTPRRATCRILVILPTKANTRLDHTNRHTQRKVCRSQDRCRRILVVEGMSRCRVLATDHREELLEGHRILQNLKTRIPRSMARHMVSLCQVNIPATVGIRDLAIAETSQMAGRRWRSRMACWYVLLLPCLQYLV